MRISLLPSLTYAPLVALRNAVLSIFLCATPMLAEPVTILALGDSLTEGYGLPPDQGFVPQLQAWLAAHGAEVTVINGGVSGDTTAGGLSRLDWSLTPEVKALIVNLGGNDLLRGIDPAISRANLDGILAGAKAKGLPVLLVAQNAPGNYGADYKTAFDAIYPDLARQYGAILSKPYFLPLVDPATGMPKAEFMQPDATHPNAKGVAVILDTLGPDMLQLLAQLPH
jgi:acyl-CoA thioesterase-1